jgi:hypothetical protein
MPYVDVIGRFKDEFGAPIFAYQARGECSMIIGGDERLDRRFERDDGKPHRLQAHGADGVLTYFAPRAARRPKGDGRAKIPLAENQKLRYSTRMSSHAIPQPQDRGRPFRAPSFGGKAARKFLSRKASVTH